MANEQGEATAKPVIDFETRAQVSDHQALRLWLRLLTCNNTIENRLRTVLRVQFDCTLPRFDLMSQLDRHPNGLKMHELSKRLMVTGGNITGLTDKLVQEGMVERRDDPHDRRAYTVHLTAHGRSYFRRMAAAHEKWITELFTGLGHEEQRELFELLGRLKQHLASL